MPTVGDLADGLLGACLDSEADGPFVTQLEATGDLLLEAGGDEVYAAIDNRADEVLSAFASRGQANAYAVHFWLQAPSSDWSEWHGRLREEPEPGPLDALDQLIERIFADFSALAEAEQEALPAQIASLLSMRKSAAEDVDMPAFVAVAGRALGSTTWWTASAETPAQARLHAVARRMRELGPRVRGEVDEFLVADLVRAMQAAPADVAVVDAIIEMASSLPEAAVLRFAAGIPAPDFGTEPASASSLLRARVRLGAHLRETGSDLWDAEPFMVAADMAEQAIQAELPAADQAIQSWLGLKPPRQDVVRVLRAAWARSPKPGLRDALAAWAQDAARADRTALVRTLITWPHDTSVWIGIIAAPGVAEKSLIDLLKAKIEQTKNESGRFVVARKARALKPQGNAGQKQLADLIIWLLARGRPKVDIAVATTIVEGLGTEHQSSRRLTKAFREATDRHSQSLKGDQAAALRAAGIEIPQGSLGKKLRRRFFP